MAVKDCRIRLFWLLVLAVMGMAYGNAQEGKSLSVKKIVCTASPESEAVPALPMFHCPAYFGTLFFE